MALLICRTLLIRERRFWRMANLPNVMQSYAHSYIKAKLLMESTVRGRTAVHSFMQATIVQTYRSLPSRSVAAKEAHRILAPACNKIRPGPCRFLTLSK